MFKDLTGQKFNKLTVIEKAEKRKDKHTRWLCSCECGGSTITTSNALIGGHTKSCGCSKKGRVSPRLENLEGKKFNKLIVISRAENTIKGQAKWNCLCDCGQKTIVEASKLKSGHTKSCGCKKAKGHISPKLVDLTGKKFGKLTVINRAENNKRGHARWLCSCECGGTTISLSSALKSGKTQSCGCKRSQNFIDITGQKYNYLTVISYDHSAEGRTFWKVKCDCGNTIITRRDSLIKNKTTSCGCIQKEKAKKTGSEKRIKEKIGTRYGKLVIIDSAIMPETYKKKSGYWKCKCDCGTILDVRGSHLRSERIISCGCIKSKGEEAISNILSFNNIIYKKQFSFKDLTGIGKRILKFDFAVLTDNNSISHLIEYDGEQHYNKSSKFYTEKMVLHDQLKNEFCEKNNIRLIRLRDYKNLTIEDLL